MSLKYNFGSQTVILDSCYSGSGTRAFKVPGEPLPLTAERGVDLPDGYTVLRDIYDDILPQDIDRATKIPTGFGTAGQRSHVLLSACRATQRSREHGGHGRFTTQLLKALQRDGTDKVTYEDLIDRLDDIPE